MSTATTVNVEVYHTGQVVHVNLRAAWLPATITSVTFSRIRVTYHTNHPAPLAGTVAPWLVRPAEGIRLLRPEQVRRGDEVVAFDGASTIVEAVRRTRDGWWILDNDHGQHTAVAPRAILRVVDPTPSVTVDGLGVS